MARKQLNAAKCSQMSNPQAGTGNGGDRCTEAVAAMICRTYNIPIPGLPGNYTGEQAMYYFTQMLNKGSYVSALEDAAWIGKWLGTHNGPNLSNVHGPSFADIVGAVNRGHIAVGGFNNYAALRLTSGGNPYKWTDPNQVGHVLLIVGYDTGTNSVIVHDPLRADPSGQPADYSWQSFVRAGFSDLSEVQGTPRQQSLSLLGGVTQAGNLFAPDESVAAFFTALDQVEVVQNPFTANLNTGLFGNNVGDWTQNALSVTWSDAQALLFRGVIIVLGLIMIVQVIKSWIPARAASDVGSAASLALLA